MALGSSQTDFYSLFWEVAGHVRWTSINRAARTNQLHPGKLCLYKLADTFHIQCVFDHGKPGKRFKLQQKDMDKIMCREDKFTFYMKVDGGTSFVLQGGDESKLHFFANCLKALKSGKKPVLPGNKLAEQKISQPSIEPNVTPSTTSKQKLSERRGYNQGIDNRTSQTKKLVQQIDSVVKENKMIEKIDLELVKDRSPIQDESSQPIMESPMGVMKCGTPQSERKLPMNEKKSTTRKALSEKSKSRGSKLKDDYDKENSEYDGFPSDVWSSFGTPHKKRPLSERVTQEVSPKRPRSKIKSFYGTASKSSLSLNSSAKKTPVLRKSVLSAINSPQKSSPSDPLQLLLQNEVTSNGFSNLGNTCYMNSVLQSLLRLTPFVQDLANEDILKQVHPSSLYRCVYNLYCCKDENAISPRKKKCLKKLKKAVSSTEMTERFSGFQQNDAHEYMNICLDQMKQEVQKALREQTPQLKQDNVQVCPVVRNFEGCIRKHIICKGCEDMTTKNEIFNHLSLNIPRRTTSPVGYGLEELLDAFFHDEVVERICEKCQCKSAVQSFKIQALPRVMIFHLCRNEFHKYSGRQEKKFDRIRATRYMDIGKFCSSEVQSPTYFSVKNIESSVKLLQTDSETPSSDIDDFVSFKPRRKLDMSKCETPPPKTRETDRSANSATPSLLDWVNSFQRTPKPSTEISSDSRRLCHLSDEEQIHLAMIESLKTKQQGLSDMSEEEQLKLATIESLKTKQQEDECALALISGSIPENFDGILDAQLEKIDSQIDAQINEKNCRPSEEQVVPALNPTMKPEKKDRNDHKLDSRQCSVASDKTEEVIMSEQSETKAINCKNMNGGRGSTTPSSSRNKGSCGTGDQNEITGEDSGKEEFRDFSGFEEFMGTPTKRRKVENGETRNNDGSDVVLFMSEVERTQLEKVLEESRKDIETKEIPSHTYRLISIVSHSGQSTSSGHYISDVFDMESEQWIRYSDGAVTKVNEHLVRFDHDSDSYIYFYMHKNLTDKLLVHKDNDLSSLKLE